MSFKTLYLLSSCRVSKGHAKSPRQQLQVGKGLQKKRSLQGQQHFPPAISLP